MFLINVQRYSQNHAQKCIFAPPYVRIGRNVSGLFDSFIAKETLLQSFIVKQRISLSEPPFGWLMGNVCDSSLAGWKACSRLPIGYNSIVFAISYC